MEIDIQDKIKEMLEKSLERQVNDNLDKPIYEFVGTYDAGRFTRYISN